MDQLEGFQRRHLRGLAHGLQPVVMIGKDGLSDAVVAKTEAELVAHELIKVRFGDWKDEKRELLGELAARTRAELVGLVGHVGILFRQNREPKKRRVRVPARTRGSSRRAC
ncbi:MAG TPA: YhbY family RNA-binding protein [Myxococcota bacterium]|nr:YhbY family RNA-binding protein [Myxococcota bacterium]